MRDDHCELEADLVLAQTRSSGTRKDGVKVSVSGFDLFRFKDGKLAEHWDASPE
jgi:predicted SnoaL-like aldol condensation-catalyzing enzyme